MNRERVAIFSCKGLGDGLIAMVLGYQLHLQGKEVIFFHPFLKQMQPFFPNVFIESFAQAKLENFDQRIIFFEKSFEMDQIIRESLEKFSEHTIILNPIATTKTDYPYWENGRFHGNESFVANLLQFCKNTLGLMNASISNGITPYADLIHKKYAKRIVIHSMSSREGKNWTQKKYDKVVIALKKMGYDPKYILTKEEAALSTICKKDAFISDNLLEIASYIFESAAMIGNDSGIGHLASCLGIKTVTICRNKMVARFWRPSWAEGMILCPPSWIPNIKGYRLRDKYWKVFITPSQVIRSLKRLLDKS